MCSQYSLSKHLDLKEPYRSMRRKSALKEFTPDRIDNIALDLDEIKNKEDYLDVIEFFIRENYSVILGKSRSWNGKTNFNLKGIIRTSFINDEIVIKKSLSNLQISLGDKCKVDLTSANMVSLQAPSDINFVVHYKERGKLLTDDDVYIKEVHDTVETVEDVIFDNTLIDECISIFNGLGYTPNSNNLNDNGSINFKHPSERKSKGGYFWYPSNPLIMNHNNRDKSISIFHLLKETEIGKQWLKNKTKAEQEKQLIKSSKHSEYVSHIYVNERYLDFSKEDKKHLIDSFLEKPKSVLKIKSAMGSAKSAGIDLCIKKAHKLDKKVILVSNRVSVAEDFADKYDLMIYKNPDSYYHKGSIVVQYDSLHKFNIVNYDVVIFDEFASLLLHHRSGLTDNSNINAVKFKILMETKQVLIADAFLTGYEDIFFKGRNIYAITNEYRDGILLTEYKNKEFFISKIISKSKSLKNGEHISASFMSLNVMRVVEMELRKANIKVITLSSETSQITRDIIYKKFKEDTHGAYQVILFTPTLTVGRNTLFFRRKTVLL